MAFKILNTFLKSPFISTMRHPRNLLAKYLGPHAENYNVINPEPTTKPVVTLIATRWSTLCITILLAILSWSSPTLAATSFPNAKIAIVDVQLVLDSSLAVKHLRESIDKISEQFSKELAAKEIEFKQIESELVKKRETLKPEHFDIEVEDFYKKLSAFQHDTQKKKEKLERAHSEAIESVHENVIKIVHEISKENGVNIALPMSQTLYSAEVLNITTEVTKRLNQKITEVQLKY